MDGPRPRRPGVPEVVKGQRAGESMEHTALGIKTIPYPHDEDNNLASLLGNHAELGGADDLATLPAAGGFPVAAPDEPWQPGRPQADIIA